MYKIILTVIGLIGLIVTNFAQNVGIGTPTPVSSAMLDITSENKGLLIPRVALTTPNSAAPVTGVVEGMLVYNTNAAFTTQGGGGKGFYYWSGFYWDRVKTGSDSWSLNGNTIFDTTNTFLGTLGNLPLKFRVGGVRAGSIERVNENLYLGLEAGARTIFTVPDGEFFPPERNTFLGSGAGRGQITGSNNTYAGAAAGRNGTGGSYNTAVGSYAGAALSGGSANTFVGYVAGGSLGNGGNKNTALGFESGSWQENSVGNTLIGHRAGRTSKGGSGNVMVGNDAAVSDIFGSGIGNHNVVIGDSSGFNIGLGNRNTLVGRRSGLALSSGNNNVMIGDSAGYNNTTGSNNTFAGKGARGNTATLQNASAIGYLAMAGASNTMVLGSINGVNGATTSVNVGIGTTTPNRRLYIQDGTNVYIIQITGESYNTTEYITQITPRGTSARFVTANANNNRMTVRVFTAADPGTAIAFPFMFVTFKP